MQKVAATNWKFPQPAALKQGFRKIIVSRRDAQGAEFFYDFLYVLCDFTAEY